MHITSSYDAGRIPSILFVFPFCICCSFCTSDRIATLCNIAQRRQDFGHPTFAAFVDLRAAFDSLSQPALWLLLTRPGIPDKTARLFRVLYDNSVSCIRTGGTHSSWFKIEAGVRQGCVLAPDLFATGMDWLVDRGPIHERRSHVRYDSGRTTWIAATIRLIHKASRKC